MYKNLLKACAIAVFAMVSVESAEGAVANQIGGELDHQTACRGMMEAKIKAVICAYLNDQAKQIKWFKEDRSVTDPDERKVEGTIEGAKADMLQVCISSADGLKIEGNEGEDATLKLEHKTKPGEFITAKVQISGDNSQCQSFISNGDDTAHLDADVFTRTDSGDHIFTVLVIPDDLQATTYDGEYKQGTLKIEVKPKE